MKKIATELQNIATQFNELIVSDDEVILNMLYSALADEWLAYFQYWAAYNCTRGKGKTDVDPQFQQHAKQELEHADMIMSRIKQLGGRSICKVELLDELCSVPNEGACTQSPVELLKITIEAEKNAISFYKQLESVSRGADPTTNRMAKQILEDQEEHLYDLTMLLQDICSE